MLKKKDFDIIILTDASLKIGYGHLQRARIIKNHHKNTKIFIFNNKIKSKYFYNNDWNSKKFINTFLKNKHVIIDYPNLQKINLTEIYKVTKKIYTFYDGNQKKYDFITYINTKKNLLDLKKIIIHKYNFKNTKPRYKYFISLGKSKKNYDKNIFEYFKKSNEKSIIITNKSHVKTSNNLKIVNECNHKKFLRLMQQSETVICSASQTLFESLFFKKKVLAIKTSKNQNANIELLKKYKVPVIIDTKVFKNKKFDLNILIKKYKNISLDNKGVDRIVKSIKF